MLPALMGSAALIGGATAVTPFLCPPSPGYTKINNYRRLQSSPSCLAMPCPRQKAFNGFRVSRAPRRSPKTGICAAALSARCAAEQTQTVERESSTISILPFLGKQTPKLDDGGSGNPPKDRGGGGGGGGGEGLPSSGGFFLFGFLLFLSFLKDKEEEEYYRRRYGYQP